MVSSISKLAVGLWRLIGGIVGREGRPSIVASLWMLKVRALEGAKFMPLSFRKNLGSTVFRKTGDSGDRKNEGGGGFEERRLLFLRKGTGLCEGWGILGVSRGLTFEKGNGRRGHGTASLSRRAGINQSTTT